MFNPSITSVLRNDEIGPRFLQSQSQYCLQNGLVVSLSFYVGQNVSSISPSSRYAAYWAS